MKMKALRTFTGKNGRVARGVEFEADEAYAKTLAARGIAQEQKAAPKPKNKKAPDPTNKAE